jgi:hypothetical protein
MEAVVPATARFSESWQLEVVNMELAASLY